MTSSSAQSILLLLALVGCDFTKMEDTGGSGSSDGDPVDTDDGGGSETGEDTDEAGFGEDAGPCSDGGWGTISDPVNTVHFWGGDASNAPAEGTVPTGEMNAPFTTWAEYEAAREAEPNFLVNAIGLWNGEHTIPADAVTAFATAGTPVVGCGSSEVQTNLSRETTEPGAPLLAIAAGMNATLSGMQLTAPDGSSVVAVQDGGRINLTDMDLTGSIGAPVISGEGDSSLTVSESVLSGGTKSVWTSGGVTSLTMNNVTIMDAQTAGVWTSGGVTSLIDVQINNISSVPGLVTDRDGWGLVVSGSDVVVHDVTINGAVRAGIVAAVDGIASFKNIKVSNIIEGSDGSWGRGIHLEGIDGGGEANLENIEIENVKETGMFIQNLANASMENISINGVTAVTTSYGEAPRGGDGLVLLQQVSEELEALVDITDVYMELSGSNEFRAIERAGIVAHCSHLVMTTEPEVMDAGLVGDYGSIFSQSSAVVDLGYDVPELEPSDTTGGDDAPLVDEEDGDGGDGGDEFGESTGGGESDTDGGGDDYYGSGGEDTGAYTAGGDDGVYGTGGEDDGGEDDSSEEDGGEEDGGEDDDSSSTPGVDDRSDEDSLDLDSSGFGFGSAS